MAPFCCGYKKTSEQCGRCSDVKHQNTIDSRFSRFAPETKSKPSAAGSIWKGAAAKWVRGDLKKPPRTIWRPRRHGAGGGTRTHTVSLPTDFESVTSTNSITPAKFVFLIIQEAPVKFKSCFYGACQRTQGNFRFRSQCAWKKAAVCFGQSSSCVSNKFGWRRFPTLIVCHKSTNSIFILGKMQKGGGEFLWTETTLETIFACCGWPAA